MGQTASRGRALRGAGGLGDGAVPQRGARSTRRHGARRRATVLVMVLAPVALVCAFYLGGCTTGGPLQKRLVSGGLPLLWPAALPWGPHHPSEGSQPRAPARRATRRRSSSPLRGIATRRVGAAPRAGCRPHHPSEGSQLVLPRRPAAGHRCPHHPSEGSQPQGGDGGTQRQVVSSSPLRGIATSLGRWHAGAAAASSSPLRGIATKGGRFVCRWRAGSSSPLRGIATWSAR